LKDVHCSSDSEEIKVKVEKSGHRGTNIWNIKQYKINLPFSMFFVDLKPAPNNKDIFNVEYIQQQTTEFQPSRARMGYWSMCRLPKIWAHNNYCHL
jgi:hypothetical protein